MSLSRTLTCLHRLPAAGVRLINVCRLATDVSNTEALVENADIDQPPIPAYRQRADERLATRKARLVYQSRKRGILENGILLSTFAARYLDNFTAAQTSQYDLLINEPSNDWDLYYWIVGTKETPSCYDNDVMTLLKMHAQNHEKELRIGLAELKAAE